MNRNQIDQTERFALAISALCAAFNREADESAFTAFEWGLEGISADAIERGVKLAVSECEFMPTPAKLRELCGSLTHNARALHAWNAAVAAIPKHGAYRSVEFDDPLINATVRSLGGWTAFCWKDSEELHKWTKKDFVQTYVTFLKSGVGGELCGHLAGECEKENSRTGFALPEPERIVTGLPDVPVGIIRGAIIQSDTETRRLVNRVAERLGANE